MQHIHSIGLTFYGSAVRPGCICIGCHAAQFDKNIEPRRWVYVMGYVKVSGQEWFGIMPFCSYQCLMLYHPALGHC